RTTASRYRRTGSRPSLAVGISARELARRRGDADRLPAAQHAYGDGAADQLRRHEALQVADALDGLAPELDDDVAPPEPRAGRRAAVDDLDHFHAGAPPERLHQPRRQRPPAAGDAEVGAAEAALAHERGEDATRRPVDRHREPEPDARYGGVDPDHAPAAIGQRAAGVPRVQGGVGLDDVLDDPARGAGTRRQGAAERAHHARR